MQRLNVIDLQNQINQVFGQRFVNSKNHDGLAADSQPPHLHGCNVDIFASKQRSNPSDDPGQILVLNKQEMPFGGDIHRIIVHLGNAGPKARFNRVPATLRISLEVCTSTRIYCVKPWLAIVFCCHDLNAAFFCEMGGIDIIYIG